MSAAAAGPWRVGAGAVHVVATATGLLSEGERVRLALEAVGPSVVALGVSPEEVEALRHFDQEAEEGEVEEAEYDPGYAEGLLAFGEVALPPPDLLAALAWADEAGVPVVGLDLHQDEYDAAFADALGFWEFFRFSSVQRRLARSPPRADSPHAFVVAWDRRLRRLKGVARVEALREAHMARELVALAREGATVVAVVPAPREEGLLGELGQMAGTSQK